MDTDAPLRPCVINYLAIVSARLGNTVNLVYLFSRNDSPTVLRTVQWELLTFGMMNLENIVIEITAKPGLRGHRWQGQMTA